ncbi:TPA: hypothetical protein R8G49_004288 [Citrobacter freundii]|nr:hypothetical protein [Citrobacter freundii]
MKIELSDQQLKVIDQALQQLPYKVAAPIIEHISKQKRVVDGLVIGGSGLSPLLRGVNIQCSNLIATSDQQLVGAQ